MQIDITQENGKMTIAIANNVGKRIGRISGN